MTARYFGIDLAWSDRNASGVCALDHDGRVVDERLLLTDDEMVSWLEERLSGDAVVAVDGPLLVPNETGQRPCENELQRVYGARKAGAHPSNRSLMLERNGRIRGEDLAARFAEIGFGDPWHAAERTLLEVYPHPTLVEAFGLDERLLYKAKKSLGPKGRRVGLRNLSRLLSGLEDADPPLIGGAIDVPADARGKRLKAIEDTLDARICAWVASVWGRHGEQRVKLFGSSSEGHIAVPQGRFVDSAMRLNPVPRRSTPPRTGIDVVELNHRQLEAYLVEQDSSLLESLATDDYLVLSAGVVEDRDQVIAEAADLNMSFVGVTTDEVRIHGGTAVVVGTLEGPGTVDDRPFPLLRYMSVFGKVDGDWRLVSRALMPIRPEADAPEVV